MNKFVRAIFMPIMILAGIFTGILCVTIFAPIALCHWFKERELTATDLENEAKYLETYHAQFQDTTAKSPVRSSR